MEEAAVFWEADAIGLENVSASSSGAAVSFAEAVVVIRQLRQKAAVKGMRA